MALTDDDVYALYLERVKRWSPRQAKMQEIHDAYQGTMALAVAEISRDDKPLVANLFYLGIEQIALRIASTMPDVEFAAVRPGFDKHEDRARTQRQVAQAWWDESHMNVLTAARARHFVGYASSPVAVRPDPKTGLPKWEVRDPRTCYPADTAPGEVVPYDTIFAYDRAGKVLATIFPEHADLLRYGMDGKEPDPVWRVVEYCGPDEWIMLIVGRRDPSSAGQSFGSQLPSAVVRRIAHAPNLAGVSTAFVPSRVGLDQDAALGYFDHLLPIYKMQARLMGLEMQAMERAVYPETWLKRPEGGRGDIVRPADPLVGEVGLVEGADMEIIRVEPSVFGARMVDTLERYQRVVGQLPAELGGEAAQGIRTGRRGDSVISNAIDYPIKGVQETLALSMEAELRAAIQIDKRYNRGGKRVFFTSGKGLLEYDPAELWDGDTALYVRYSNAGVDLSRLIVDAGQRMGMGTLSKRRFMQLDPMVDDPEAVADEVRAEALDDAGMAAIQAHAQQDPAFLPVLSRMAKALREDRAGSMLEIYERVSAEYAAEQAKAQQGQPLPPEAGMPGATQPDAVAAIQGPSDSTRNLTDTLMQLTMGQRAAANAGGA